jgi:CheY-like chemotaxis protein
MSKILIVDDNPSVLRLLEHTLTKEGYEVFTAILKNDAETRDIPILIISVVEDKQKAFRVGANDYLTKPFKIEEVMEKINKLLQKAQKAVLLVDDDKALVKSLKYKLEKRGISTYTAYNGKEALQLVNKTPPNLILLDIVMPEMDGYEVMSRLKRDRKTTYIPIIVLTGVEIDGGRVINTLEFHFNPAALICAYLFKE